MKTNGRRTSIASALLGALMAIGAGNCRADDVVINAFNDSTETDLWHFDYGSTGIVNSAAFSTEDAEGKSGSGSLEIQMGYGPGSPQCAFTANFPTSVDASTFTSLELDVKVDTASALDSSGNATYFQVALRVGSGFSYNKQFQGNVAIVSTNNGWRHLVASPLSGSIDNIHGITLDPYDGNYPAFNGPTILRIDNIKFTKPTTVLPPPAPKLFLRPVLAGLNLIPTTPSACNSCYLTAIRINPEAARRTAYAKGVSRRHCRATWIRRSCSPAQKSPWWRCPLAGFPAIPSPRHLPYTRRW